MTLRQKTAEFLERPGVNNAILGVILFNAMLLGLETSGKVMAVAGPLVIALDIACLTIFVAEIAAKLFG